MFRLCGTEAVWLGCDLADSLRLGLGRYGESVPLLRIAELLAKNNLAAVDEPIKVPARRAGRARWHLSPRTLSLLSRARGIRTLGQRRLGTCSDVPFNSGEAPALAHSTLSAVQV